MNNENKEVDEYISPYSTSHPMHSQYQYPIPIISGIFGIVANVSKSIFGNLGNGGIVGRQNDDYLEKDNNGKD